MKFNIHLQSSVPYSAEGTLHRRHWPSSFKGIILVDGTVGSLGYRPHVRAARLQIAKDTLKKVHAKQWQILINSHQWLSKRPPGTRKVNSNQAMGTIRKNNDTW